MAERRMFTKKVTDDDNFMNLSASAQALYLHLSMSADDDGFSNQVNVSMFKAHASVQDLQALLEKRYIYQFENGVIVIKHWRMANALRKDRYTPTAFQEELAKLSIKDNGSYTMSGNQTATNWQPDGIQRLPQDSIGKDRKGKDRIDKSIVQKERAEAFEIFWQNYPRKAGKGKAEESFAKVDLSLMPVILEAIEQQKRSEQWNEENGKYIPLPATWLNQKRWGDELTERKATLKDIRNVVDLESWGQQ